MASEKIFGDEEEEEDEISYRLRFSPETSDEEASRERKKRSEHIYETFVKPVLKQGEDFTPEDVIERIRPPYNEDEIEAALEYGVAQEEVRCSDSEFKYI
ncbi:MAG: hypothetical protein ABEJ87_00215 [Candidatus Nanohalobium sp.]